MCRRVSEPSHRTLRGSRMGEAGALPETVLKVRWDKRQMGMGTLQTDREELQNWSSRFETAVEAAERHQDAEQGYLEGKAFGPARLRELLREWKGI